MHVTTDDLVDPEKWQVKCSDHADDEDEPPEVVWG
jgi:hypothetical protein